MKRLFAMFGIFALASAMAAYVALAPNAPLAGPGLLRAVLRALDTTAAQLIALRGRSAVVLGLLGLGVVLGLLAAIAIGESKPSSDEKPRRFRWRTRRDDDEPEPGPMWRPEPLSTDDRIASLRRRAESEAEDAHRAQASGTPPVILVRKARVRERDWFADASWIGGLPRLGEAQWPRDPNGMPLPFAAQIDLAELATVAPASALPHAGSLAFFLGNGAVVAVDPGWNDYSEPPADLPPAYDEGGEPFPMRTGRLSRFFFPFWPVEPIPLAVPADLDQRAGPDREAAIVRALAARKPALVAARPRPFRSEEAAGASEVLWWHSVNLLADQLQTALEASGAALSERRAALEAEQRDAAALLTDPSSTPAQMDLAERQIEQLQGDLAQLQRQRSALPEMIHALDGFTADREPWVPLTAEEQELVAAIVEEVNAHYADLAGAYVAAAPAELATMSLRAMLSGPPDALAQVPEAVLTRINRDHRLALRAQHRMLGPAAGPDEVLLLQLGADDLVDWRWDEGHVFRFRIASDALEAGDWARATLSFEEA